MIKQAMIVRTCKAALAAVALSSKPLSPDSSDSSPEAQQLSPAKDARLVSTGFSLAVPSDESLSEMA